MTTAKPDLSGSPASGVSRLESRHRNTWTVWLIVAAISPCLISFFGASPPGSQPPLTVTKSRPALLFATYMFHHGDEPVELTPTLESEFRFRNEGTEPVNITSVERSCGCMLPRFPKEIAPNETAALYVPIQTINQTPGPHEYTLTVHYSDPEPRQTTLTIKAIFPEKMVVVQPKALYLSQKSEKPFPLPAVSISDFRDSPFSIRNVISTAAFISASIDRSSSQQIIQTAYSPKEFGSTTKINGEVSGNIPPGRHHALIAAGTDDPEYPVVVVPIIVNGPAYPNGQAPIASPSQIRLVASDHPGSQRKARIQMIVPATWDISHATSWPEELAVEYKETDGANSNEKTVLVDVTLSQLPASRITDGVVQLFANGGKNLITSKVTLIWP